MSGSSTLAAPGTGIDIFWSGGLIDSSNLPVGDSVPFSTTYPPPVDLADGSGAGGLAINGSHIVGGVYKIGFRRAKVRDARFYAGDHWDVAGGDSCCFVGGAYDIEVTGCYFQGGRDNGLYLSNDSDAANSVRAKVAGNHFYQCFNGVFAKRSLSPYIEYGNTFQNCVQGGSVALIAGTGAENVSIFGNAYEKCTVCIRATAIKNGAIFGNTSRNAGATLSNGNRAATYGLYMIWLPGAAKYVSVHGNRSYGMDSTWVGQSTTANSLVMIDDGSRFISCDANESYNSYLNIVTEADDGIVGYNRISKTNIRYMDTSGTVRYARTRGIGRIQREWITLNETTTDVVHTGTTSTTSIYTYSVPANSLEKTGRLRVRMWGTATSNANNKICSLRIGGTVIYATQTITTEGGVYLECEVINNGSVSSQKGRGTGNVDGRTDTVNTSTTDLSINVRVNLANAGDTFTMKTFLAEIMPC